MVVDAHTKRNEEDARGRTSFFSGCLCGCDHHGHTRVVGVFDPVVVDGAKDVVHHPKNAMIDRSSSEHYINRVPYYSFLLYDNRRAVYDTTYLGFFILNK